MTSSATAADTEAFYAKHSFFGLTEEQTHFFQQVRSVHAGWWPAVIKGVDAHASRCECSAHIEALVQCEQALVYMRSRPASVAACSAGHPVLCRAVPQARCVPGLNGHPDSARATE